ncbi:MAG: hypothetical protein JO023_17965 [Chloroflexi bacterium]|nr:hypothetical protein [Chloroflexota bacterium]
MDGVGIGQLASRLGLAGLVEAAEQPWIAYLTVCLLQFKVISADWEHRDLRGGDSGSYFWLAQQWHEAGLVELVWSPLYQVYVGSLLALTRDAYIVTMLHRWILIFGGAVLTLWLMRRLLPHGIAWLVAAWWTLLLANYNVLYEVHLFSLIPVLVVLCLLTSEPGPWRRGIALAVLAGTALLVRNELSIAVAWLAVLLAIAEGRTILRFADARLPRLASTATGYIVPSIVLIFLLGLFYSRAAHKYPEFMPFLEAKHTINVCQVYAFSYKQRHTDWTEDPWLNCQDLMTRDFGAPYPSLMTAIRSNPRAMLEHFWWNTSLAPSGLQALLFNATSSTINPDYAPTVMGSKQAFVSSVVLLALLALGAIGLLIDRQAWWAARLWPQRWVWLSSIGLIGMAVVVIATQRPRPEYLQPIGLLVMAATGLAVAVLGRRLVGLVHWGLVALVVITCLFIATQPYLSDEQASGPNRPQLDAYRRLFPFDALLKHPDIVILGSDYTPGAKNYLGSHLGGDVGYDALKDYRSSSEFEAFLNEKKINLIYFDEAGTRKIAGNSGIQEFLGAPQAAGWELIASGEEQAGRWVMLERTSLVDAPR